MERQLMTTADGSHSIYVPQLSEHYHSVHGAVQESEHVFINAGLLQLPPEQTSVQLLEIGFGTGLNAFLTFLHNLPHQNRHITYTGIEAYPLPAGMVQQLNYVQQLGAQAYASVFNALHTGAWEQEIPLWGNFTLLKRQMHIQDLQPTPARYHLIYFDAFAPTAQPELWTTAIFETMYLALLPGGILCTYCAKGAVKRILKEVGFTVESLPGPPGKRQMTRAVK
ncbi:SAM-dependent methyltransferase [Sphingobacteriales bacterium UPWRP_1]|nr:SAM-dependent methyltransferase [Sphingobacteriales bacterium UPWRP_1]